MSSILDPRVALKLAKICALFSSPVVGERASAAERAHQMLRLRGLTCAEVLAVPQVVGEPEDYRRDISFCLERIDRLSEWEQGFVRNLRWFRRGPSAKQAAILAKLVAKCRE